MDAIHYLNIAIGAAAAGACTYTVHAVLARRRRRRALVTLKAAAADLARHLKAHEDLTKLRDQWLEDMKLPVLDTRKTPAPLSLVGQSVTVVGPHGLSQEWVVSHDAEQLRENGYRRVIWVGIINGNAIAVPFEAVEIYREQEPK